MESFISLPWERIGLAGVPLVILIGGLLSGRLYTSSMVEKLIANRDAIIEQQNQSLEKSRTVIAKYECQVAKLLTEIGRLHGLETKHPPAASDSGASEGDGSSD